MKRILLTLVILIITTSIWAQSPEKMSFQAVVRDANDMLKSNTSIGMRVSILQGSINGTAVYIEEQYSTTNINGLVTIEIGEGSVIQGSFSNIDWANGIYFIKTETDINGGTNYTITGISQLLSVPYALYAKIADSISGGVNEIDPVFNSSIAKGISSSDTSYWNNKLSTEIDGSITNEIQLLSINSDTLFLSNGGFVILPYGFDGQYSSLTGTPTNLSNFTNDVGFLNTEVDGSITNEIQLLSINNDTILLSNGGYVVLPTGFDGQYSSLTGTPTSLSNFTNDAGFLSSEVDGSITNELQLLSINEDTIFLSNGGFVVLPDNLDNDSTNELQSLSLVSDTLRISDNSFVVLPYDSAIWNVRDSVIHTKSKNVVIGADSISNSAIFEIKSDDKGVLFPRMTKAQRISISNPNIGLLVFQTDEKSGFYYYGGTNWLQLSSTDKPNASDPNTLIYTTDGF